MTIVMAIRLAGLLIVLLVLSIPVTFAYQEYSLIYDGNGNLITGDGKFRVYNDFNQLVEVYSGNDTSGEELEFYLWHPTEDRILMKKVFNGSVYPEEVVVYVNDNFDKSYTNPSADAFINETYYVYDDYGLVGEEIYNTTFRGVDDQPVYPATFLQKIFYHSDHLGSTTVITNSSGGVVEETFYDPYGEIISGGEKSRYDYEGKEFSSVTGDYDFNFRKYDPELGIFTQPDAVLVNVYDPQQLNRYSFERRNPYGYVDRDGKTINDPFGIERFKLELKHDINFIPDIKNQLGVVWDNNEGDLRITVAKWIYYGTPVFSTLITISGGLGEELSYQSTKDSPIGKIYYKTPEAQNKLNKAISDIFFGSLSLPLELTPSKILGPELSTLSHISTGYSIISSGGNLFQDLFKSGGKVVNSLDNSLNSKKSTFSTQSQSDSSSGKNQPTFLNKIKNKITGIFKRR
jgi:RHS repeat-associated protein